MTGRANSTEISEAPAIEPKYSGCLRLWLVLLLFLHGGTVCLALLPFGAISTGNNRTTLALPSDWESRVWFSLGIGNCICIAGIWRWKRWSVYGAVAGCLVSAAFMVLTGGQTIMLIYVVGLFVLLLCVRASWSGFQPSFSQ
jgi:hypothetical protein